MAQTKLSIGQVIGSFFLYLFVSLVAVSFVFMTLAYIGYFIGIEVGGAWMGVPVVSLLAAIILTIRKAV